MEQIIANLLVPDNAVIQMATTQLQSALEHPETIPLLCDVVVTSKEPQIRQYAAVCLRRRLGKLRHWQTVNPDQQQIIKVGMLNAIPNESEKSVRNAICQFVAVLVRHEFPKKDAWTNDVLKFLFENCSSSDPYRSELGSSMFSIITDMASDQFLPHMEPLCEMFSTALASTAAAGNMVTPVIFNIIQVMAHMAPFILGHNGAESTYQKSIPYIIKALEGFVVQSPDQFIKAFDVLENMADYTPKLLSSNLRLLIDFCLRVGQNGQLDDAARVRAVSYIGWLVRLKKQQIIKQKLVEPIVQITFNLMATSGNENGDEDDEEYFVGSDDSNPRTTATQTMDLLALHVPPEKLMPTLLGLIEPALKGSDPLQKKAAYLSMAVIAEGCGETICSKYLKSLLECVKMGIVDPNPVVRNAALFALGQFSEHLQPDITKYADEILPILFEFLHQLCNQIRNGGQEPKHIDRMFYALETFCENLEDAIVPYLPVLMERLFEALSPTNSVHLRELSLSAVSSTASAAKQNMLPYFEQIIKGLQMYLVRSEDEDICALRPQAIDTLAAMARCVGKENFMPLANDTMTFALSVLEDADDPELRSSLYNLLAALAEVVNGEMAPVLPKIVERMLDTVKSSEEVVTEIDKSPEVESFDPFKALVPKDMDKDKDDDDIDIENSDGEDDDDDDDIAAFAVENAFLDEKEEAILALKQICEHTGRAFSPYIQACYEAIYKLLDHPTEDIRKVSIEALTQFILTLHSINHVNIVAHTVMLLIPKLGEIIKNDEECSVVMTALEAIANLLKDLKHAALPSEDVKTAIYNSVYGVLDCKVACQFNEPNVGNNDDLVDSEYDEALMELAGDIFPKFGEALRPQEFALMFGRLYSILTAKIEKCLDNEDLASQRSFAYGTLSECWRPLQNYSGEWFKTLLPLYLRGLGDKCEQVRQNAVFGLGEMTFYAEDKAYCEYQVVLQALSAAVAYEKHAGTLDNICGALARLIVANCTLIPLVHVVPVFVMHLPLREDFDENNAVFKSFQTLLARGCEYFILELDRVIMVGLNVLYKKEYKDDATRDLVWNFLKDVRTQYPDKFNAVASSDPNIAAFVQGLL